MDSSELSGFSAFQSSIHVSPLLKLANLYLLASENRLPPLESKKSLLVLVLLACYLWRIPAHILAVSSAAEPTDTNRA